MLLEYIFYLRKRKNSFPYFILLINYNKIIKVQDILIYMINEDAISELVKLARYRLQHSLGQNVRDLRAEKDRIERLYPELKEKKGVFVTLTKNGELRGCIGYPYPIMPLSDALIKAAESAAFSDPRFEPLTIEELNNINFEISVLTLPTEITSGESTVKQIKIGKDGLIIEMSGNSGLLLPQVAVEYHFDALDFLQETCTKAGLPRTAWMNKNCKIYKFQAEIFKEISKGKVIKK